MQRCGRRSLSGWRVMNGWARQALVSTASEVRLGETGIYKKSEAWRSVKRSGHAMVFVSVPFRSVDHGIILPPSPFGPSNAFTFFFPNSSDTRRCSSAGGGGKHYHLHIKRLSNRINASFTANQTGLPEEYGVWMRMNLVMIIEFFTFYHRIYTFIYSNTI